MGNNTCDFEKGFACGSQQGLRAGNKNLAEEAYQAGKCLGYNLGYNLGFESGYEKGYIEGSNLGYNNGFVAALRNEESGGASSRPKVPEIQVLQKLIADGKVKVLLAGCGARDAEFLLHILDIEAVPLSRMHD